MCITSPTHQSLLTPGAGIKMSGEVFQFRGYIVRHWASSDREKATDIIRTCLEHYGLKFEPESADKDAIEVEEYYWKDKRGEFWVVVGPDGKLVGTGGFYEIAEEEKAVEIRKMYLLPEARGKKLGRTLLEELEKRVEEKGYHKIYIETASVLSEACSLYNSAGYVSVSGVETPRCDKRMYKAIPTSQPCSNGGIPPYNSSVIL